jgi:hypothetical protein
MAPSPAHRVVNCLVVHVAARAVLVFASHTHGQSAQHRAQPGALLQESRGERASAGGLSFDFVTVVGQPDGGAINCDWGVSFPGNRSFVLLQGGHASTDGGRSFSPPQKGIAAGNSGAAVVATSPWSLLSYGHDIPVYSYPTLLAAASAPSSTVWTATARGSFAQSSAGPAVRFVGIPAQLNGTAEFLPSGGNAVHLRSGGLVATVVVTPGRDATIDPRNDSTCCNLTVLCFGSPDGSEWHFLSEVASLRSLRGVKSSIENVGGGQIGGFGSTGLAAEEGANENALTLMSDGVGLLCVMRIDGGDGMPHGYHSPYAMAISRTAGASWEPWQLMRSDIRSARPKLLTLPAGPILLVGGRPGLHVWENPDGRGLEWVSHDIPTEHNLLLQRQPELQFCREFENANDTLGFFQSHIYSSVIEVADDAALLCYSRVFIPGYTKSTVPEACRTGGGGGGVDGGAGHATQFCMRVTARASKTDDEHPAWLLLHNLTEQVVGVGVGQNQVRIQSAWCPTPHSDAGSWVNSSIFENGEPGSQRSLATAARCVSQQMQTLQSGYRAAKPRASRTREGSLRSLFKSIFFVGDLARLLLAGSQIFNDGRYLAEGLAWCDSFTGLQHRINSSQGQAAGFWGVGYGCYGGYSLPDNGCAGGNPNNGYILLADTGTAVQALALGASLATGDRAARYIAALERYGRFVRHGCARPPPGCSACPPGATGFFASNGSLGDGYWPIPSGGALVAPDLRGGYTIATATTGGGFFSAMHALGGEADDAVTAQAAARWILDSREASGRIPYIIFGHEDRSTPMDIAALAYSTEGIVGTQLLAGGDWATAAAELRPSVAWLLSQQNADGSFGEPRPHRGGNAQRAPRVATMLQWYNSTNPAPAASMGVPHALERYVEYMTAADSDVFSCEPSDVLGMIGFVGLALADFVAPWSTFVKPRQ